jgi:hypothetical protein
MVRAARMRAQSPSPRRFPLRIDNEDTICKRKSTANNDSIVSKRGKTVSVNLPIELIMLILSFIPSEAWNLRQINRIWRNAAIAFLERHPVPSDLPLLGEVELINPRINVPDNYPRIFATEHYNAMAPQQKSVRFIRCEVQLDAKELKSKHAMELRDKLTNVYITMFEIEDHMPVVIEYLRSIPRLSRLGLWCNRAPPLDFLVDLPHLKRLVLRDCALTTTKGLECLVNLEYLNISLNRLPKLGDLSRLIKLRRINTFDNPFDVALHSHSIFPPYAVHDQHYSY